MFLKKYTHKINRNIVDYGYSIFFKKLFSSLFSIFYLQRTYRIYFYNLSKSSIPILPKTLFEIRLIKSDEEKLIGQIEDMAEWLEGELKTKLIGGDICLCALDENIVAGFNLITFNKVQIPLLQLHKVLRPKIAWSEQITVHKNYRRKGIASMLRANIIAILQESGYTRLFGGALRSNTSSLNLAKKLGFSMLADMTLRKIFFIKIRSIKQVKS